MHKGTTGIPVHIWSVKQQKQQCAASTRHSTRGQVSLYLSLSLWLMFKGLFLYTGGVLFHMECCIRKLWSSSIISCNITITTHNHHTDIYSFILIITYLYLYARLSVASLGPVSKTAKNNNQLSALAQQAVETQISQLGVKDGKNDRARATKAKYGF